MAVAPKEDTSEELEDTTEQLETSAVDSGPAAPVADAPAGDDVDDGVGSPSFSAQTLELAGRSGLDPNDYRDEAAFYRAVARQDRAWAEWSTRQSAQTTRSMPNPTAREELTPQAIKRLELDKYFAKGPDGEIDPSIVEAFKAIHGDYYGHLEGLHKRLNDFDSLKAEFEELKQYRQQEEHRRFVDEWDTFFAQVDEEYRDKIGVGNFNEIGQLHGQARDTVVRTAMTLRHIDEQQGLRPLSNKQYGQRALLSVYSTDTNAIARKQLINQAKKRSGAALHGANGKLSAPKDPEERAWKVFREKAAKAGLRVDDED